MISKEYQIIAMVLSDHLRTERQFQSWWNLLNEEEKNMAIFVAVSEELILASAT